MLANVATVTIVFWLAYLAGFLPDVGPVTLAGGVVASASLFMFGLVVFAIGSLPMVDGEMPRVMRIGSFSMAVAGLAFVIVSIIAVGTALTRA